METREIELHIDGVPIRFMVKYIVAYGECRIWSANDCTPTFVDETMDEICSKIIKATA